MGCGRCLTGSQKGPLSASTTTGKVVYEAAHRDNSENGWSVVRKSPAADGSTMIELIVPSTKQHWANVIAASMNYDEQHHQKNN